MLASITASCLARTQRVWMRGQFTMSSLRVAQRGARGQLPSTRPIFFQLMFDQVMFGSTLLAIPRASMFLFEGLAIGSAGVSSVSIEASALAAC
jgi:hypothetical protein